MRGCSQPCHDRQIMDMETNKKRFGSLVCFRLEKKTHTAD